MIKKLCLDIWKFSNKPVGGFKRVWWTLMIGRRQSPFKTEFKERSHLTYVAVALGQAELSLAPCCSVTWETLHLVSCNSNFIRLAD